MAPDPSATSGLATTQVMARATPRLGVPDVIDALLAKAAALTELAELVARLREDGWNTVGETGLEFSLGGDGVSIERTLVAYGELESAGRLLPPGTVVHWRPHEKRWRSGGWIIGLPAESQFGEADELPVIVQSTRSGRQTRCADQDELVHAVIVHLQEIQDSLGEERAHTDAAVELRAHLEALGSGEPPQIFYRFDASQDAEDGLSNVHFVQVQPEANARWEGFHEGVTGQVVYDGDPRLEGLIGLAFSEGHRLGVARAELLVDDDRA